MSQKPCRHRVVHPVRHRSLKDPGLTVSEHLRNVYDSGELHEGATLRKIRIVRTEGSRARGPR